MQQRSDCIATCKPFEDELTFVASLRGKAEVARMMENIAADPVLSPLLSRCQRPYIGIFPVHQVGSEFASLVIPCPDRVTAQYLNSLDWGHHYMPFQGSLWCIVFKHPQGHFSHIPKDPRIVALTAALRALVSPVVLADVEVADVEFPGWNQVLENSPVLMLGCSRLETLNEYLKHMDAIQAVAMALIPELQRMSLHLCGYGSGITACDGIMLSWMRSKDGWWQPELTPQKQAHNCAVALLHDAGLDWPFKREESCTRYIGLDVAIHEQTLSLSGERDAVNAVLALLQPIEALAARLQSIPPIAGLRRIELTLEGQTQSFPLNAAVALEVSRHG